MFLIALLLWALFGCTPARTVAPASAGAVLAKAARPILADEGADTRWAIVVGVGDFEDGALSQLTYPERDAHSVARALVEGGGYAPDHVILLATDMPVGEHRPTAINLRLALSRVVGERASSVLVYFSGHGVGFQRDEARGNRLLLEDSRLAVTSDDQAFWPTDVALIEALQSAGVKQVILLMDACRNELQAGARAPGAGSQEPTLRNQWGVIAMYCNSFGRPCYEDAVLGGGVFTTQLLSVWADPASDTDGDGRISSSETQLFLGQRLAALPRADGAQQELTVKGEAPALDVVLTPAASGADQNLRRSLRHAAQTVSSGGREQFLSSVASIEAHLPLVRRRVRQRTALEFFRLEAARAALVQDDNLAALYLLAVERNSTKAVTLKPLWPLGPTELGALECRHARRTRRSRRSARTFPAVVEPGQPRRACPPRRSAGQPRR